MAQFSRIEVALKMEETGIVPVFFHKDIEICKKVVKACYDGGIRVFEFTNRGDFAHEVFAELIKWSILNTPEMILGIGSIVDPGTTSLYIQLGANFVVSPVLNPEMAKVCNRRKILWSPGCGSLSDISYAEELGAEVCKIFPGSSVGGPDFVKAIKGPCPWSSIMPTGGVTPDEENLTEWIKSGVTCVGMGSQLIGKDIIENDRYEELTQTSKRALKLVRELKKEK
ncbi:bifunctional 4-hydroxy-2-oxoglutarate aldolase/2-dehydro-3-deoxy-phosphogluconate aldolase [Labilibaculum sp. DW002]|uniref:Bifunctional 4-hydroxy-2-oxoglutarate aldolase/2-dehydro-3-deoxy-phosphogluconate aldolase n=1 Tax=Paralabilibaculum antarcticum TaxID=2912572 RepID=A0ABT5VWC7_9BACT|nr:MULTISPECIES: bifunctional 4-hydroxy-2-oxoglutarate aldolase/2-dehydro-3-deoxy-phosphogluconate aldolase [unclassified Labilibaculum]MBI9058121.1 bifunctional 4-hydroxy-2-oxoglutarate aldolase/2-dehydro-3-deoxy-phosphogluconate aldolase [Labilibaculum sp.]MDE5418813.1 bifunctional 4-hydroxy-2-oxoglutarate aldolase/2-dehydro-3-deoxy-phosphogluconate aldolase [Labilibaculum sp. DW002]